ncbi:NADPH-dependent 7-cyano-7-deazaguanine reductase [Arenicella chitinivorans]|uniref:NADPH-dependent 7-cyano-7-deazaguanine reductase n=1 Tax=Arenicella chitinivorans TaxID=1329800 RepID=A0A918VF89_9GAMM|nr:NADPH-dependent 7-cyano-7-deazaguanine reductase QueF [Arenicella chitinivorans]GGZ96474.1 NADPH-dependent 7-cyano-7-deazaguanine reductase [Arenicella chitinivorans]
MVDDKNDALQALSLGRPTEYVSQYSPELLQPVPRSLNRTPLGITSALPFAGHDVWQAFELSWLNPRGKPMVALAQVIFDAGSINIVESKSFKLYLNSFNQSTFASQSEVAEVLQRDLEAVAEGSVRLTLMPAHDARAFAIGELPGTCLDALDIDVQTYTVDTELLQLSNSAARVAETVHSHLLKSNCLITNQPDWASVIIKYEGTQVDHAALLRYLISFRQHNEFHEQCVERIFVDVMDRCAPQQLAVQALYTRRGGLDISPMRYTPGYAPLPHLRTVRQ